MNREQFCKMSNIVLRQQGVANPEPLTNALAAAMDLIAMTMGDAPAAPAAKPVEVLPPRASFPVPNPEAFTAPPAPEVEAEPSIILAATSIPENAREVLKPRPAPAAPAGQPRMKVEQLSQLIQERTPNAWFLDVAMPDGAQTRVFYDRNVISRHNFDSVVLIYSPRGASTAARDSLEVQESIAIDDLPVDLTAILARLKASAMDSIRPKGAVREVPVRPFSGAISASKPYEDGGQAGVNFAAAGEINSIMGNSAGSVPSGYVQPELPSQYHPDLRVPPTG